MRCAGNVQCSATCSLYLRYESEIVEGNTVIVDGIGIDLHPADSGSRYGELLNIPIATWEAQRGDVAAGNFIIREIIGDYV